MDIRKELIRTAKELSAIEQPKKLSKWIEEFKKNILLDIKDGYLKKDSSTHTKFLEAIKLIQSGKKEKAYSLLRGLDSSKKDTIPSDLYNWIQNF